MKISISFIYIIIIGFIYSILANERTYTRVAIAIVLYIIFIAILFKEYKKNDNSYRIKSISRILTIASAAYISYSLFEFGFSSYFGINSINKYEFEIIDIILGTLFTPIAEELIFRGIMLNKLNKKHSFIVANGIQALIFACVHFNKEAMGFLFIYGIMAGVIYKNFSVYIGILIHVVNNLIVVILVKYHVTPIILPKNLYLFIGIVFLCLTLKILWSMSKKVIYEELNTNGKIKVRRRR